MNEQTAALVSNLAAKLGTTTEYLWAVLLKQAPIQGWIMLLEYGLTFAAIVALFKYRATMSEMLKKWVQAEEFTAIICIAIGAVSGCVWVIACLFCFETMMTAFLNPEYWALKQVLASVKK